MDCEVADRAAQASTLGGYVDYEFDLTLDEARSLDAGYRARALSWMAEAEFPEMDRALALDSPFTKFHVIVYEWESGLA